MRIRTQLFLGFFLLSGAGFSLLINWILDDLRPRYQESAEELLIDTANLLASLVEAEMAADGAVGIPSEHLREAFRRVYRRPLQARIREVTKTRVDLRVYLTDSTGKVLFDSEGGGDEGKDFSRWRDVYLTLRGGYGARSSPLDSSKASISVMHVAAPVRMDGRVVGVLTVAKPSRSINLFLQVATPKIAVAGLVAGCAVAALGLLLSALITRPINRLTDYARAVRDGGNPPVPALGRSEIGEMGRAFEEMREALEGKKYVEQYVHTLTHELKSPLSSLRGATELLQEDASATSPVSPVPPDSPGPQGLPSSPASARPAMSAEKRAAFLSNIRSETDRMQQLVDRMLDLTALENRRGLQEAERLDLSALAKEALASLQPALARKGIRLEGDLPEGRWVEGEAFLLRQAVINLLENALAFSPQGGTLQVTTGAESAQAGGAARLEIRDQGPGIPDFARERVFEKFYSLQRPDTGKKSSGMGLAIVQEITRLHSGSIRLENRAEGGLRAVWEIPQRS